MENDVNQKQIEEMAREMLDYGMEKYPTEASAFTETLLREQFYHVFLTYAEHLIKKGYRKINENEVVLTREEYEKVKYVLKYEPEEAIIRLKDLKKNEALYNPHMFCSLSGCNGVSKDCNRTCKESWIVKERKETAEKFAEMLKDDVSEDNELHERLNAYLKRDYFEYIDERCKEFTNI